MAEEREREPEEGFGIFRNVDELELSGIDYDSLADQLENLNEYYLSPELVEFPEENLPNITLVQFSTRSISLNNLEQLLHKNRQFQQCLRNELVIIDNQIRSCKELQKWIKRLKGKKGATLETDDNLRFLNGFDNSKIDKSWLEYQKILKLSTKWSEKEKTELSQGIRSLNMNIIVNRIVDDLQIPNFIELNYLKHNALTQIINIPDRNQRFRSAITFAQGLSQRDLEMNLDKIDWGKVSSLFVPSKSADDCRIFWTTNLHPLINRSSFSKEECENLKVLVASHGENGNWIKIAELLGTNRSAWQCLAEYRRMVESQRMTSGKWTEEEDQILKEAFQLYEFESWSSISELLEGRTASQCHHRWSKVLRPNKKLGRWSSEEDAWLAIAVSRLGTNNWATVQSFVPNRTDVQCRERYMNVLIPNIKKDTFNAHEDQLLSEAILEFGEGKWSQVASRVPNRTDSQCRRRWLSLTSMRGAQENLIKGKGRGRRKKYHY